MIISAFHISRVSNNNSIVAVADITLNNNFVINSIRLLQKEDKLFMAMPRKKNLNGNYQDIAFPVNQSVRTAIEGLLFAGYQQVIREEKQNLYFYLSERNKNLIQLQLFNDFYATNFFNVKNEEREKNDLNITDLKIRLIKKSRLYAVCTILLENELVVRDIKLVSKNNGEMLLIMPSYRAKGRLQFKNIAYPINAKIRRNLENCIFQAYSEFSNNTLNEELSKLWEDFERKESEEPQKRLFNILWDASDNGYILQSRITPILQEHNFDWQKLFQVSTITELVQRIDFLKIKKLEPKPNMFVNWIVVSTQKGIFPTVESIDTKVKLPKEIISGIHKILYENSKSNEGNMLMSEVVPVLQRNNPDLFCALPKTKISIILKACDFAEQYVIQNDETNIQVWVHITPMRGQSEELQNEDDKSKAVEIQADVMQEDLTKDEKDESSNKLKNSILKDETGKVITALNNPFQYIPNSVFWPEYRVVKNGVEVRNNALAVKSLGIALKNGNVGRFELDVLSWITKLIYVKNTMILDLIRGGYIKEPGTFGVTLNKVGNKLLKMYKYNLIDIYRLASIDAEGNISSNCVHRVYTITNYGHNQLKDIGRESFYNPFVVLQDADIIRQRLSLNQWFLKWMTWFPKNINRYFLNKVLIAKVPVQYGVRINAVVECNCQPIFAMSIRRGNDWNNMRKSGEFNNKFQRIMNLILHYSDIFYDNQNAEFVKKPIVVFIGEDIQHCKEIFYEIKKFIYVSGKQEVIVNVWFCCDLDVYNNFPFSHFTFDNLDTYIPVNIFEKFDILEANITQVSAENEEDES